MQMTEIEALELTFQFEAIFEAFPDILFKLSRDGEILFCKAGRNTVNQLSPERYIGKNIKELLPEGSEKKFNYAARKLKKLGDVANFEFPFILDNTEYWFEARLVPFYKNQLLAIVREITEKKKAEQALAQKVKELSKIERYFAKLADNLPNGGLVLFDKDLRFKHVAGPAVRDLGFIKEEVEGRHIPEVLPESLSKEVLHHLESVLTGETVNFERVSIKTNHTYLISIIPLQNENEEIEGGMIICLDIEKQKANERDMQLTINELHRLNEKLNYEITMRHAMDTNLNIYTEELKKRNQELENFGYIATHDLQEPLRMVSVYSKLLVKRYKDKLDDTANEFFNFAIEGAQRMQEMIYDLRDYTSIDQNGTPFTELNATSTVGFAIENIKDRIDSTAAEIRCDELPLVKGDKAQIVLLFQHLLTNAIKFTKDGQKPVIHISAKTNTDFWEFSVKDNGIGIETQYKDRIFRIFQRLNSREKYTGTGIGLAICKKIVERHGGEIWVESKPGKGSVFHFTISRWRPKA